MTDGKVFSFMSLTLATSWTVAHQAPLSMGFPRQKYWNELLSPPDLPDPGIKPVSPALAGRLFTTEPHQESPKGMDSGGALVAKSYLTIATPQPARFLCQWDFPGKNTGVGYHFLLEGIFPTWGLNPGLPHCRQTLYPLGHQETNKNNLFL